MREIKFRAWTGKKMVYIGHESNDTALWIEEGNNWAAVDHFTGKPKTIIDSRHTDASLMQYTGANDASGATDDTPGKEIYEGDIVTDMGGDNHEVEWNDDLLRWQLSNGKPLNDDENYGKLYIVVGNIFENPELLNQ